MRYTLRLLLFATTLQELTVSEHLASCSWGPVICLEKEMGINTFQSNKYFKDKIWHNVEISSEQFLQPPKESEKAQHMSQQAALGN